MSPIEHLGSAHHGAEVELLKAAARKRLAAGSIRKFVRTARRYRTIEIQAGEHTITAADPLPTDLSEALDAINGTHRLAH